MSELPFVTQADWKEHLRQDWRTAHGIWSHIKAFAPGWGYTQAEIDAFFEGEDSGKKQVDWARITSKPSTFPPSAHTLASHSSKAHDELSDAPDDAHHAKLHAATHILSGADELDHDDLAGFASAEHLSLPNTMANVLSSYLLGDLSNMNIGAPDDGSLLQYWTSDSKWHDVVDLPPSAHASTHHTGGGDLVNHDSLTNWAANKHVVLPNTIANVLSNHNKAIHDGLDIDARYIDGTEVVAATPSDGHVLTYVSAESRWEDKAPGPGTLAGLTDTNIGAPENGEFLQYFDSDNKWHNVSDLPPSTHAASHHTGGGDLVSHDSLTGFVAAEHKSLPNTIAQVLSDHNVAVHNALDIAELGTVLSGVWQGTAIANAYIAGIDQNLLQASEPTFSRLTLSSNPSAGDQVVAREYIESRLQNLITNGSGLMEDNYNFTGFIFDQVETHGGYGSFKHVGASGTDFSDEYMPIDGEKFYRLALWGKSGDVGGGNYNPANKQYVGICPYDIDKLVVAPYYYRKVTGSTDTTLAVELKLNDTTITLVDATGWYEGPTGHQRHIIWYGYTNSKGYTYPDYTYSRTESGAYYTRADGAWAENGITGNVITLRSPWTGPTIPVGSAVRNNLSGGSYKYITLGNVTVPNAWTRYEGYIGGWDVNGGGAANLFPYGTAFVRLLFLNNYSGGTSPTNIIRWSDIWFSEMSSRNIEVASTTRQGVVDIGAQSFAGNKTFTGDITVPKLIIGSYYLNSLIANNKVPDSDKVDGIHIPNSLSNVINSGHDKTAHDALDIDARYIDGVEVVAVAPSNNEILTYISAETRWEAKPPGAPGAHRLTHEDGGADETRHDMLDGYVGAEHLPLPRTFADVINAGHTAAIHNSLALDHGELSNVTVDQHHLEDHTLASHTTRPHSALSDAPADAHHPQSHSLSSHSTKAHSELSDAPVNAHHAQTHTLASHTSKDHHLLAGLADDDHSIYYNAARHTKAVHDALDIDARYIDGKEVVAATPTNGYVLMYDSGDGRWEDKPIGGSVSLADLSDTNIGGLENGDLLEYWTSDSKWHNVVRFPDTIANILSDHTLAAHNALAIDHGSLAGRGDDDHSQYYNSTRHTKAIHTSLGLMPYTGGTFSGIVYARDHGTGLTDEIVNVCYGTGSPPTANLTTIGTIFLKYT